ncbi:hypothetical protein [Streptomyces sp. SID13726]|uniref:hypothetical protein n=1 Tax=Streptomyces sp. SID13726 TaxID=2706058 RepID=UPI0013BE5A63|nr:hypothetical protein [Streptomyces sp. SID13726]NEB03819.1 hypothetical protein [Streptomyces sp. SID13726]
MALCLAATAACSGSGAGGSGPIGARQTKGVDYCKLLSDDTMAEALGVKKVELESGAATDDCEWKVPADGEADGQFQIGSFYLPEGSGMTTVGGLQANRQIAQSACQIVVTANGQTDPAATSANAVDAVRVWYLAQGVPDEQRECEAAGKLAEKVMRALPEA